jgi:hypothetical protein
MRGLRLATVLIGTLAASHANAFGWELTRGTDQGVFFASAGIPGIIGFRCGGQFPGQSGTFPMFYQDSVTPPGEAHLGLFLGAFSSHYQSEPVPGAAMQIGGYSYTLRDIAYSDYYGEFFQTFSTTGALLSALQTGAPVTLLENNAIRGGIPTQGMGAAISGMINYCSAAWAGQPLPTITAETATMHLNAPTATTIRARAHLTATCRAGHTIAPEAFLTGDLDGDGQLDTVVAPETYSCNGSNPMCGAMMCGTPVFLSSRPGAIPDDILGNGPRLEIAADGGVVLRITQRCADGQFGTCPEATYRWDR